MKRVVIAAMVVTLVASCGGGKSRTVVSRNTVSSGPIATACMQAGRSGASYTRCGCVQSVADASLSHGDQRLGASFFSDPHRAQEIRQSDKIGHSEFWKRWKAFGDKAAEICT